MCDVLLLFFCIYLLIQDQGFRYHLKKQQPQRANSMAALIKKRVCVYCDDERSNGGSRGEKADPLQEKEGARKRSLCVEYN